MKITWQQPTKKIKPPNTKKLPEKPKKEKIFQTSTDIFSDILSEKGENNSFIVQSVYSFEDKKVLVTKEGEVVLEEKWAELKIESGDCFSVYKCPCCLTNTTNDIYLNPIKNNSTNFTTSDKNIILVINDDSNVILILNDNLMNVTLISESFDCINKPFFRSKVLQFSLEPLDKFIIIGRIIHSLIEKYYKSNFSEGNLFKKVIDLLKEVIKENDLLIKKSVYFLKNNSLEMNQLVMNDCLPHLKYLINFFEKVNGLPEVFFTSVKYGLKGRVDLLGECVYEFKSTNLNFKHQIQSVLYLLLTDKPVILVSTKNGNNLSFDLERKTENKSMTDLERKTESKLNTDCSKSISENKSMTDCSKSMTDCSKSMTENKFNLINHQLIRDILILRNKALINIKRFNYEECNKCLECILYSKLNKCYSLLFNILKEEEENKKIKVFYKRQDLTQEKSISGSTVLRRVFFCHSDLLEKSFYKVYFNNTFITKCKVINNYLLTYDLIDFSNFIYFYLEEDCDIFFYVYRYSLLYTNEVFKMFDEERIYERFMKNKLISKDNGLISKDDRLLSKDGLISKDNGLMTDDCKSMTGDCKLMTDDKIINSSYFGVSNLPISLQIPSYFTKEFLQFNAYQRKIILYSLNLPSKFYLIHGLPGTGKSKCIRFIVKLLTNYSKKVLVMTYTNRSLDLLKGIDNAVYINCFNYTELTEYKFDYLIVDEATQMHFPFCLVGLDMCDKIVLFGDDKQLAPICKDRRLGISIFELVKKYLILNQNQSKKEDSKKIKVKEECEKIENFEKISFDSFSDFDLSDENISNNNTPLLLTDYLKITYRMSIKITALANILFYNNKLISHSKHVGEINYFDTTDLSKLLLLKSELVVLCFYNDTVSYVKSLYNLSDKQVSTIDRYQGSECENVILFVDRMSELCKSRERVNVAVTRSKKMFYLVGDRKMISECEVLSELIEVIERIKDD